MMFLQRGAGGQEAIRADHHAAIAEAGEAALIERRLLVAGIDVVQCERGRDHVTARDFGELEVAADGVDRPRNRRFAAASIASSASMPITRAFGRTFTIAAARAPEPVPRSTTAGAAGATAPTVTAAESISSL